LYDSPTAPLGWIGLLWSAYWIVGAALSGPERVEVDPTKRVIRLLKLRRFRASVMEWCFDQIAGFDLHEQQARRRYAVSGEFDAAADTTKSY
jgi:hypothetical protein